MFQLEFARTIHAERVRDIEQRAHHRRLLEAAKALIPMHHDPVAGAGERAAFAVDRTSPAVGRVSPGAVPPVPRPVTCSPAGRLSGPSRS